MENDPEVAAALARLDAVIARGRPEPCAEEKEITGMARWVRKLWPQIQDARLRGFSWREICDLLNEAEISLNDGCRWRPATLSAAAAKERRRHRRGKQPMPPFQASLALLDIAAKGIAGDDGELQGALIALAERCEALDMRQIKGMSSS